MNKEKIYLPVSILLSGLVLGIFIYAGQVVKYSSLEKQQRIRIEQDEIIKQKTEEEKIKNEMMLQSCLDAIDKGMNDYRQQDQDLCFKQYLGK